MVSQVKAKPAAAEALLTSMKTTLQRPIWPLHIAAATSPRAIILRVGKAASGVESVQATQHASLTRKWLRRTAL
jgi:hypothetical protein